MACVKRRLLGEQWPVDLVTGKLNDGEKGETGQEVEKMCG